MFKKDYKIIINKQDSDEAFRAVLDVFNTFGKVNSIEDFFGREDVLLVKMSTTKKKFNRMVKGIREQNMHINEIKGYWFM